MLGRLAPGAKVEAAMPGCVAKRSARDDVVARCLDGLAKIDRDYPDSNVVVVCHGTIMKYTLIRLTGHPIEVVANGSVSAIERDGEGWRVLTVNGQPV